MKPKISTNWTFRGVLIRKVSGVPGAEVPSVVAAGAGTKAGNDLPLQCAGLISLRSSIAPSKTRGRFYMPGAVTADVTANGAWAAGRIIDLDTMGVNLKASYLTTGAAGASSTHVSVLWKRSSQSNFAIDQTITRAEVATQRRRGKINRGDASPV